MKTSPFTVSVSSDCPFLFHLAIEGPQLLGVPLWSVFNGRMSRPLTPLFQSSSVWDHPSPRDHRSYYSVTLGVVTTDFHVVVDMWGPMVLTTIGCKFYFFEFLRFPVRFLGCYCVVTRRLSLGAGQRGFGNEEY